MLVEQTGHLLVQLADLLLEELQLLQHHLQQPSVHGLEFRARTERIAQLFRGGSQLLISQSGQSRRVGFSLSQRLQHAASTSAQQIRDQAGQLDWASSNSASSWFCSRTLSRVSWYFVRVTVRQRRCSASGTKLKINPWDTSRFTRRSASKKSLLRPRRPRFDKACAKCSVPDIFSAPSRF